MKYALSFLLLVFLLSACAPTTLTPALTPAPLRQAQGIASPTGRGESTPTPAPTETPTATPVPTYSIEQLQAMTSEQKLALAPQAADVPQDVLASYLPAGAEASSMTWGEQTLTFWERVVAYHGQTADGQTVTMYFDLESGQWAKKYASFDEAAKIPADQVPDVMVLTDAVMGDDRLIRAKLQYDYDWISQPQVMIDGKKVFRDDKGYPKAVFDTVSKKWLTPKEADVVWTWEKWQPLMEAVSFTSFRNEFVTTNMITSELLEIVTDPNEIMSMRGENPFLILNPSGIITAGDDRNSIAARLKEGATVITRKDHNVITPTFFIRRAVGIARNAYEAGYRDVRVEVGESKENLEYNNGEGLWLKDLVTLTLDDGTIVTPILLMPPHFKPYHKIGGRYELFSPEKAGLGELDLVNWLDKLIKAGVEGISVHIQ